MKKLIYVLVFGIFACTFNACSKLSAQELDAGDQNLTTNTSSSSRYIIVSGTTFSQLQTAVQKYLPSYKLTGGPFLFHANGLGTEHYGQALYK